MIVGRATGMMIDMLLIIAIVMAVAFLNTWWEDNR